MLVEAWIVKAMLMWFQMKMRRGHPFYKVAKNLPELCLCSSVLWKIELGSDKMEYLSEAISNSFRIDSIEGTVWFFLTAYSKI